MALKEDTDCIIVNMTLTKECKGSIRYSDSDPESGMNIYIKKSLLNAKFGTWPKSISLLIESED